MAGKPTEDAQILTLATVGDHLFQRGLLPGSPEVEAVELSGGVSNVVIAAHAGDTRLVVKQALPRLRVADEWLAKRERAISEAEALQLTGRLTPGCVPELVDLDRSSCTLVTTEAPATWTTWKARLLEGEADPAVASRLAAILATWHRSTSGDAGVAAAFSDLEAFDQLRIDPYYRTVAARRPELSERIASYVARLSAARICLVHGDYSPKNVLVGEDGLWVIDFEVSHVGDPAFDLAFMLNHLLLKYLHVPGSRAALTLCVEAFWEGYLGGVPAALSPEPAYTFGHLGCLMAARVDGKSPAEYLRENERLAARELGAALILEPPTSLDGLLEAVASVVA